MFSPWLSYDGELQLSREKFLADAQFNTLQDDLYDNDQAEVLGRIQTSALSDFTNWDWAEGEIKSDLQVSKFSQVTSL